MISIIRGVRRTGSLARSFVVLSLSAAGCSSSAGDSTTTDGGEAIDSGNRSDGTPDVDSSPVTDTSSASDTTSSGDAPKSDSATPTDTSSDATSTVGFHPTPGTSWQWQISGTLDTSVEVQVYDIDLFDTSAATIAALHAKGRKVICYFDTAYEPGRPDSSRFTSAVLGNPIEGWPGQRWVDIRSDVVKKIMTDRMDVAVTKKCDGVEPDDVDAYSNDPGFPITYADNLVFLRFLAKEGHARGLGVGLKNDLDQIEDLVADFDFAVNEECFAFDECDLLKPFITARKAVFQVEYGPESLKTTLCPKANALDFDTLIKKLDLDAWRVACR